jgi:hypothetical protein
MDFLTTCKSYSALGYDISLTSLFGKEAIRMVKRYSKTAERHLVCEQIYSHDKLTDEWEVHKITQFLYDDIQKQEAEGIYRNSGEEWLNKN